MNKSQSGYTINTERSTCSNGATPTWVTPNITINNLSKSGTSCYLYFDKNALGTILANKTISYDRNGTITGVLTDNTTGTIYSVDEDNGTSYIFAGEVDNNWIRFAGFYWRIIRINNDGSIRMIYSGTDTGSVIDANCIGEETQIGTIAYNSSTNDNAYVGYMYGSTGANSYSATHANSNNSAIKGTLDTWYQSNLASYSEYISSEAGFCNDRSINTTDETWWGSDTKRGYETNDTAYAPFSRFLTSSNTYKSIQAPTLECGQINDLFTAAQSSKGNHALTYPIGLITVDEVVLAGGFGGVENTSYYLYTNQIILDYVSIA